MRKLGYRNHSMVSILAVLVTASWMLAAPAAAQWNVEFDEDTPHLLTMILGGTYLDRDDETAFTLGADYEFRINPLIGVGGVVEYAFGDLQTTTLLAVADVHIWRGLSLQIGPGVEFGEETLAVGRIGGIYEFKVGERFRLMPQIHYDGSREHTIVFGIGIGRAL